MKVLWARGLQTPGFFCLTVSSRTASPTRRAAARGRRDEGRDDRLGVVRREAEMQRARLGQLTGEFQRLAREQRVVFGRIGPPLAGRAAVVERDLHGVISILRFHPRRRLRVDERFGISLLAPNHQDRRDVASPDVDAARCRQFERSGLTAVADPASVVDAAPPRRIGSSVAVFTAAAAGAGFGRAGASCRCAPGRSRCGRRFGRRGSTHAENRENQRARRENAAADHCELTRAHPAKPAGFAGAACGAVDRRAGCSRCLDRPRRLLVVIRRARLVEKIQPVVVCRRRQARRPLPPARRRSFPAAAVESWSPRKYEASSPAFRQVVRPRVGSDRLVRRWQTGSGSGLP